MDNESTAYDDDGDTYDVDDDSGDRRDTEIGNVRVSVRIRPPTEDERTGVTPGGANCVDVDGKRIIVSTGKRALEPHSFSFDYVFDPSSSQEEVCLVQMLRNKPISEYDSPLCRNGGIATTRDCLRAALLPAFHAQVYDAIGSPLLDKAFGGYNATIFAYGQTGAVLRLVSSRAVAGCASVAGGLIGCISACLHAGSGKTHTMSGSRSDPGIIPRMNRFVCAATLRDRVLPSWSCWQAETAVSRVNN
jgi:hypothetical protein